MKIQNITRAVKWIWGKLGGYEWWLGVFWGLLIWDLSWGDVDESTFLLGIICLLFAYLTRICDLLKIIYVDLHEGLKQRKEISIAQVTIDKIDIKKKIASFLRSERTQGVCERGGAR